MSKNTLGLIKLAFKWKSMKSFKNLFYLYGVQGINLAFPLLILPFLSQNFDSENIERYLFYSAVSVFSSNVIEYGFNLSAVRSGSIQKDTLNIRKLHSEVISVKLLLGAVIFFIQGIIVIIRKDAPVYLLGTILLAFSTGFLPIWYFQIKQNLQMPALVLIFVKVLSILMIYHIVGTFKLSSDFVILGMGFSGFLGLLFLYMKVTKELGIPLVNLKNTIEGLRSSYSSFLYLISTSLFTSFNVVILGLFSDTRQVVAFGICEKIINLFISPLWSVQRAFLPYFSRLIAERVFVKIQRVLIYTIIIHLAISVGSIISLHAFSTQILAYFGLQADPSAINLLYLMSFVIIPIYITSTLSIFFMIPMNLEKNLASFTISAAIFNIILGIPLSLNFGAVGMAVSVFISESVVLISILIYLRLSKLTFFRRDNDSFKPG